MILKPKISKGNALKKLSLIFSGLLISLFALLLGCEHRMASKTNRPVLNLNKVAVLGLLPYATEALEPADDQKVLSGGRPDTESIPPGVAQRLSFSLHEIVASQKGYKLAPPGKAMELYSKITSAGQPMADQPDQAVQQVGKDLESDAVLVGYVYRWKERQGSDYGVESPASVTFDLRIIRPLDGVVLWKSVFDKTQKSLSENLFDMETFVESGGKWLTAEGLAEIGIKKLVSEMP